ncbi:uncharacterized protein LOC127802327 [Diospyros lotus]|uniref:uncharacterized protein LOC127802327 n=1 Tax=Diospyros lotus TaxID=55363 RepID=UPI00224E25B9|nr:uncharacterized protein LOC127802327 [Diospyros lotus]
MDCNKDEAIRAKEVAEQKMQNGDFEGARKIAQKAQQLFPELENISQLLTVCNVHCSSQDKIRGSKMDWYGILQVQRFSDEVTIKKQYRKLALALHPDKNKFPGAEAAFKIIGEANMVLSDQVKRSLYDNDCRNSIRINPSSSNGRKTFWTSCPFCSVKFNYCAQFVNKPMQCLTCSKPFIAYDLGAARSSHVQPVRAQQNGPQSSAGFFPVRSQDSAGFIPNNMRYQGNFSCKTMGSEPLSRAGNAAVGVGGATTKMEQNECTNQGGAREMAGSDKVDAMKPKDSRGKKEWVRSDKVDAMKPRESRPSRNTSKKRARRLEAESDESCDVVTSADNDKNPAQQNSGVNGVKDTNHPRRSSRKRQHVSYNENLSDNDDDAIPVNISGESGPLKDKKGDPKEESFTTDSTGFAAAVDGDKECNKQKGNGHHHGNLRNSSEASECEANGVMENHNAKTYQIIDDSESDSDSDSGCVPEPEYYDCPDTEFYDFDKDKEVNCFAANQIWACYDPTDGMPRFYARVREVFSPEFKLQITWLESHPADANEINWLDKGLPVACGRFIHGDSEETMDRLAFSHQVHCEKNSRGTYVIYPRKGQTWALFKDWHISWSSHPENQKFKFEIVEVMSNFGKGDGIKVAYLDKVDGFISVFQRRIGEGNNISFLIPPGQLLRFSHQIPSFKLIGTERDGVPDGSFELDPASLPKFDECANLKMEAGNLNSEATGSDAKSPEKSMKSMNGDEKKNTPKKGVGLEGNNDLQKEFRLRRSPRQVTDKGVYNQMNTAQYPIQGGTPKDLAGVKDKKGGDVTPSKRSNSSFQGDEAINLLMEDASPQRFAKSHSIPDFHSGGKILEEFHNFNGDKSEGKLQSGQLWALYNEDGLPRNYAQVKQIESCPLRLHVAMLEPCTVSKDGVQAVCCGTFRLQNGRSRILSPTAFSHAIEAESIGRNRFEIYPRKGEIWALFKDWKGDMSSLDLKHCKCMIVEVLEDNQDGTKVSPLIRLNGFKSVFKAPRRGRSSSGYMEIPRAELARFSHQIPRFELTGENDGYLRGCWELDPLSIPGNLFGAD